MNDNANGGENRSYRVRAETELNKKLDEFIKNIDESYAMGTSGKAASVAADKPNFGLPQNVKNDYTALLRDNGFADVSDIRPHSGHRARMRAAARRDLRLDGFRDSEMLEMFLSYLIPRRDTSELAHKLTERYGSVLAVLRAPADELATFPFLSKNNVRLFPVLAVFSLMYGGKPIFIKNHIDAADYFGALFYGSAINGTFAVCISSDGKLLGIERCDDGAALQSVLGVTVKYNTRHVILIRRERSVLPNTFDEARRVNRLTRMLKEIGINMADFMLFTDHGYYTLGSVKDDCCAQYIFVPIKNIAEKPDLIDMTAVGGKTEYATENGRMVFASSVDGKPSAHFLRGLLDIKRGNRNM